MLLRWHDTLDDRDIDLELQVVDNPDGSLDLTIVADRFVARPTCRTRYGRALVQKIFEVKGPYVCDEIMREEDPNYVTASLDLAMTSYVAPVAFAGKRVLDFGCGGGASTIILARMLAAAEIVGVELVPEFVRIAEMRAEHYGLTHARFLRSPSPETLPDGIGQFDYVVMSANYEHLLPNERPAIMSLLWSALKPGGVLFLNQTPNRWSPVEGHTTGLPLINYLPDGMAGWAARRFSKRIAREATWEYLLRAGIRGGTNREIVRSLGEGASLLQPSRNGIGDRIDLWFKSSMKARPSAAKQAVRMGIKALRALTGVEITPVLSLAIEKASTAPHET